MVMDVNRLLSGANFDVLKRNQQFNASDSNPKNASIFGDRAQNGPVTLSQDAQRLLEEYQQYNADDTTVETEQPDATRKPDDVAKPDATKKPDGTPSADEPQSEEEKEIQEKINKLKEDREKNDKAMNQLEDKIKEKAEDAEEKIMQAKEVQEAQVEEGKADAQQVLKEQMQQYISANKEGGEGMTRDQLQENIKAALPDAPQTADAMAALTAASEDVNEMDKYLGKLNELITDTKSIDKEIEGLEQQKEAAKKAAEAEAAAKQCCDPIGFTVGEGEDKVQYDFIKDDGNFDQTSDFLGSEDNFKEMEALDTDGDKVVTADELEAGGIKAVKTGKEGKQDVVDIKSEFGDDFSIDLNSYKEGGTHDAIDTTTGKQSMLGTFDINIGGDTVNAYNTLDDVDYLSETYNISAAEEEKADTLATDLQAHVNFFDEYTEKSAELKEEIAEGFQNLGLSEDEINEINETTKKEADEQANIFISSLELPEKDKEADTEEKVDGEETVDGEEKVDDEKAEEGDRAVDLEGTLEDVDTTAEVATEDELVTAEEQETEIPQNQEASASTYNQSPVFADNMKMKLSNRKMFKFAA